MKHSIAMAWLVYVSALGGTSAQAEELNVLPNGADKLLYDYLVEESRQLYLKRTADVRAALQSPEGIAHRQSRLQADYRTIIGELPREKTPLHAEVTGIIQCEGYKIEKVIFESRPGHRVTANLYVPLSGKGPFPAVAVPCGHSANGKGAEAYQSVCALLALNGFVALIYDPICQGERHQALDAPRHGTTTHTMLNPGSLLVGRTIAGYEAWDGIRCIDYLLSRQEVDRDRPVGLTGNSGGGTQTTFLMALDDRIGPAAPSCYIMRKQRKFETIGPADGCQNLPNVVARKIDQIDFFWMRAPKPTLILAAERDFFDFQSTKDAADEAMRLYAALDKPERTGLFSHDDAHGFSQPRREAAVSWMKRWLLGNAQPVSEPKLKLQDDRSLQVTSTGQVVTAFKNEDTVVQMNFRRAKELAKDRTDFWAAGDKSSRLAEIRRLVGSSARRLEATIKKAGTISRDGYRIDKIVIQRKLDMPIPALLFVPDSDDGNKKFPATVYVDGRGKASDAGIGGAIERLVRKGHIVLSIDARGFGETADHGSDKKFFDSEYRVASLAIQLGRPLLGQRIDDVLTAADILSSRNDVGEIDIFGIQRAGPIVLHAAAIDERFTSVTLRDSIHSWVDDVVGRCSQVQDPLGYVAPGALLKYDMPDLINAIAPRHVNILQE